MAKMSLGDRSTRKFLILVGFFTDLLLLEAETKSKCRNNN